MAWPDTHGLRGLMLVQKTNSLCRSAQQKAVQGWTPHSHLFSATEGAAWGHQHLGPGCEGACGETSMAPVVTGSLLPWQVPLHAVWQPHRPAVPGQCTLRAPAAAPVSGYDGSPPRRPSVGKKDWGAGGYGHPPHSADWELGDITRGLLEPQDRQFGTLVRINSGTPCEWAGGTRREECPFWT